MDLRATVKTIATQEGWLTLEAQDQWLILTNGVRLLFIVLPGMTADLSREQARWISALLHGNVECHGWRMDDREIIQETLTQWSRNGVA